MPVPNPFSGIDVERARIDAASGAAINMAADPRGMGLAAGGLAVPAMAQASGGLWDEDGNWVTYFRCGGPFGLPLMP